MIFSRWFLFNALCNEINTMRYISGDWFMTPITYSQRLHIVALPGTAASGT